MKIFNKALRILLCTNALILIAGAMLGPIYAIFVQEIGGDILDASVGGSLFALAAGITSFASGKYSDKIKNKELIVVLGYFIMGIGFLSYLLISSIIHLFIAQILIGLGEAIYSPAFDSVYSKHINQENSGKQWGAWESMNYFTTAFGALTGGIIVSLYGFNTLFITMSLLCFFGAFYIYNLPRKTL